MSVRAVITCRTVVNMARVARQSVGMGGEQLSYVAFGGSFEGFGTRLYNDGLHGGNPHQKKKKQRDQLAQTNTLPKSSLP